MALPLVAPALLADFGLSGAVALTNPLRADESVLRMALVPGLVRTAALNTARGNPDVTLFELGTVFFPPENGAVLPVEREHVAALVAGSVRRAPVEPDRPVDAYDAVDLARVVLEALAVASAELVPTRMPGWRSGHVARVVVDGDAGRLRGPGGSCGGGSARHRGGGGRIRGRPGCPRRVPRAVTGCTCRRRRSRRRRSTSRSCSTRRCPQRPSRRRSAHAGGDTIESIHVFDEFRRDELGAGRRSVAFNLRFRAADRTLTDAELAQLRQRCIDAVVAAHGAELRG